MTLTRKIFFPTQNVRKTLVFEIFWHLPIFHIHHHQYSLQKNQYAPQTIFNLASKIRVKVHKHNHLSKTYQFFDRKPSVYVC